MRRRDAAANLPKYDMSCDILYRENHANKHTFVVRVLRCCCCDVHTFIFNYFFLKSPSARRCSKQ